MLDKAQTVPRNKIGTTVGRLHQDSLVAIDRALAIFLGIA
jgi:mRNA interferase MazF